MKFLSIEEQFVPSSGYDQDMTFIQNCEIFLQRYGKTFDYCMCLNYLRNQPKWLSYVELEKAAKEDVKQPIRPLGKKVHS